MHKPLYLIASLAVLWFGIAALQHLPSIYRAWHDAAESVTTAPIAISVFTKRAQPAVEASCLTSNGSDSAPTWGDCTADHTDECPMWVAGGYVWIPCGKSLTSTAHRASKLDATGRVAVHNKLLEDLERCADDGGQFHLNSDATYDCTLPHSGRASL